MSETYPEPAVQNRRSLLSVATTGSEALACKGS